MEEFRIKKYPRTPHLEGSRLQKGDEDLSQVPFSAIRGRNIVIEEKIDGANTAISFDLSGNMLLQSRGHYLTGGSRERHYNLFKKWADIHMDSLFDILGARYIMYGEWMYAKHTVYYDALEHYFYEFDIFDRTEGRYLDTDSRRRLIGDLPIVSVPVLARGSFDKLEDVLKYIGRSNYISDNKLENLRIAAVQSGVDPERAIRETDSLDIMEGIYIKVEEGGSVVDRMKYVRASFTQNIEISETHWLNRPIIPNGLAVPFESLLIPKV
ncbi:MAG: DNA ligase [Ruminococcaceae bacterium]|nr:DNA ligase [Oscillospiraceae bacterium]